MELKGRTNTVCIFNECECASQLNVVQDNAKRQWTDDEVTQLDRGISCHACKLRRKLVGDLTSSDSMLSLQCYTNRQIIVD